MADFIHQKPQEFNQNIFTLISENWLLITAENQGRVNAMTASWGGFGHIWNKYTAYFFIRPSRFTKTLVDAQDRVSLCALPPSFRDTLNYLGTASGFNEDKIQKSGLTVAHEKGTPYFTESRTAFICKKLFAQDFTESSFFDPGVIRSCYPKKDFHTFYVAEIEDILVRNALSR